MPKHYFHNIQHIQGLHHKRSCILKGLDKLILQLNAFYGKEITLMYYYVHHESCCVWTSDNPNEAIELVQQISKEQAQKLIDQGYNHANLNKPTFKYAGIGSRNTPKDVLRIIHLVGHYMAIQGHTCSTGAALGADQAFANGAASANGSIELCLPWYSYNQEWVNSINHTKHILNDNDFDAYNSVDTFHPAPEKLKAAVRKLHARNYLIIHGSSLVICWTPGGKGQGGTGQGIRIAKSLEIPVYDYGHKDLLKAQIKHLVSLGYHI